MRRTFVALGAALLLGCNGDHGVVMAPVRPVAFVPDAWTQPVPAWGPSVRLNLPVALSDIVLGPGAGLGAYGAHQGGHCEGLDHVWIPTRLGIPVRSWAAGTVTQIVDRGPRGTADGRHEYFVSVDDGDGLVGQHMDVDRPLVKVGDRVDESSGRAALTIEWRKGSFPPEITTNAAIYKERAPLYLAADVAALGINR